MFSAIVYVLLCKKVSLGFIFDPKMINIKSKLKDEYYVNEFFSATTCYIKWPPMSDCLWLMGLASNKREHGKENSYCKTG